MNGQSTGAMDGSRAVRRDVLVAASFAMLTCAATAAIVAQQPSRAIGGVTLAHFELFDTSGDGAITRDEMRATFDSWFTRWDTAKADALNPGQVFAGASAVFPPYAPGDSLPQNQTPDPADVAAMIAALPDAAPAKPRRPRKVLVLGRALGFVHSSIPLAARTVEEIGRKTGAWTTTITYDAADINDANLKQYDAIFLASTTGEFLDHSADAAATAARRKALLDFVRGGKGLAGIHAATDGYHRNTAAGAGPGMNLQLLPVILQMLEGDRNADGRLTRDEFAGIADAWFAKLDTGKTGRVERAVFPQRYAAVAALPRSIGQSVPPQGPAKNLEPDTEVGTWPEFNQMLGAIFKFHWNDGQAITVKIDEPQHPINAPFKGQPYTIVDETYTFGRQVYDRSNLRVLTSIDYAAMSAADKAKEEHPRKDGDYALSWIRREGQGRVFYEAHGHNEKVYANAPLLQHLTAGLQYVLGDLPADDGPSARAPK
jgi:type 1 glutamine amidotransferase